MGSMTDTLAAAPIRRRVGLALVALVAIVATIVGAITATAVVYGVGMLALAVAVGLAVSATGTTSVATVVAAGVAAVGLAVPWMTRGGESGDVVGRSDGAISWGWQRGPAIVTAGPTGLAITDSTLQAARPLDVPADAAVWAARGPLMFVESQPDGLAAFGADGVVAWTKSWAASEPEWVPVAAFDDGAVVIRRCADGVVGCELVAVDPTGATRWETTSTVDPVARPAGSIAGPTPDPDPDSDLPRGVNPAGLIPALPSRLVGRDAARTDGAIIEIDAATGQSVGLAVADQAVAGDGFVVAVTDDGDRCRINVTTPDSDPGGPPVTTTTWTEACDGELSVVGGNVIVDRRAGGRLVIDGRSGVITRVDTGPAELVGEPVVTVAGVLYDSAGGWRFGSMNDPRLPFGPDPEWELLATGQGVVVFSRATPSRHPFHDDRLHDIALFDPRTGGQCASAQVVGERPVAVALEGCRALIRFDTTPTMFLVSAP